MLDHVHKFVDGLSIPFFRAGRRTLTISRSLAIDQPDWLLWIRRDAPQVDTERVDPANEGTSGVVAEESRREWQKRVESLGGADVPDPAPEGVRNPKRAVKIDVCTTFYRGTSPF